MQGSVRSLVWRCVIRRGVRFVDWYVAMQWSVRSFVSFPFVLRQGVRLVVRLMSPCTRAFAPLYGDVSFDVAFASLIDIYIYIYIYVAMQWSVRSFVWRCSYLFSIMTFDGAFASLVDIYIYIYMSLCKGAFAPLYVDVANFSFLSSDVAIFSIWSFYDRSPFWMTVCWSCLFLFKNRSCVVMQRGVHPCMSI